MLKKANRISKNKEFDRIFKTGQSFYGKVFGIKATKNNLDKSRFSIMISTKVSKKAVVRNHFKRQIREIIKQELPAIKTGYDVVFIVFYQILDKKFEEIKKSAIYGFSKLNLYK